MLLYNRRLVAKATMIGSVTTLAVLIACAATVGCSIFKKIDEDLVNAKAAIESEIGGEGHINYRLENFTTWIEAVFVKPPQGDGNEAQIKQRVTDLARKHFRYGFLGLDLSKGYVQRVDVSLYPSSNFRRKTTLYLIMNSAPVGA